MQKFHEYMNSKSKIVAPVVKTVADLTDPMTPPNKPKDGGANYKCSDGKLKKANEKGFAQMGDQKLKYCPHVDMPKGKAPATLPTAEAVQKANQIVREMFDNPSLIEHVVRQMKKQGLLGALVAEVFEQKESSNHLAMLLAHETYGPKICRNLNKAMNEEVAKPFSSQLQGVEDEEIEGDMPQDPDMEDPNFGGDDLDVDMAPDGQDPNMGQMDQPFGGDDTNMMDDPSQMGMSMNPALMGDPSQQQPPPPMPLTMQKFQRAMMRAYQKAMMSKF